VLILRLRAAPLDMLSRCCCVSDRLEFSSLSERVWLIYTLYVLHECQLTRPKYAIPLPEGKRDE